MVDEFFEANLRHWDEAAQLHPDTDFYRFYLDRIRAGGTSLHDFEVDEVGEVAGMRLLHLQCHIGTDSISWAKRGAIVTAVDFSSNAVAQGHRLAKETGVDIRFLQSNIYDLPMVLEETFDVVFTSWGVLGWLPDTRAWGHVAGRYVTPGGIFYIAEFHPFGFVFDDESDDLRVRYPYFPTAEPLPFESDVTYADAKVAKRTTYSWPYTLADVITSLSEAGLQIEFLRERPRCVSQVLKGLARHDVNGERWFRLPEGTPELPLSFSLRARRPAS